MSDASASSAAIVVLGAASCEDTAIVLDRLRTMDADVRYADIDLDSEALAQVRRLNGGEQITPTVIVGEEDIVVAEPSLEQLGELVRAGGQMVRSPTATQLHGEITGRAIPTRTLSMVDGRAFTLDELRGKRQVALLLTHSPGCLPCFGYARQLSRQRQALDDAGATSVVVTGSGDGAAAWAEGLPEGSVIVTDPGDLWKTAVARHLGVPADHAILVLLDRYLAPRVVAHSPEAGGLADPFDAVDWLRFIELECPECSGEIEWPEEALTS